MEADNRPRRLKESIKQALSSLLPGPQSPRLRQVEETFSARG